MSARSAIKRNLADVCAVWNRSYPIGTKVLYWPSAARFSKPVETITTSEAWILGGHSVVVNLEGFAGCVAVSHVKKRES